MPYRRKIGKILAIIATSAIVHYHSQNTFGVHYQSIEYILALTQIVE